MTKFGKLLAMLVACDIVTLTRLHEPKCFIYKFNYVDILEPEQKIWDAS